MAIALSTADIPFIIFVAVGVIVFLLIAHFLPWDEDYMDLYSEENDEDKKFTNRP